MWKRKLLLFSALFVGILLQAQNLHVIADQKGRLGYADKEGNIVIPCKYNIALPFQKDGVAKVAKKDKFGLIDTSGKLVVPLKYEEVSKWNNDVYLVNDGKKYGLYSVDGTILQPVKYSYISKPNQFGKAWISSGGKIVKGKRGKYLDKAKHGIVDHNGKIVIPVKYVSLMEFDLDMNTAPYGSGCILSFANHYLSDTLATNCDYMGYSKNKFNTYNAGLLDKSGNILIKEKKFLIIGKPSSDMVRYYKKKGSKTECGYYNLTTKENVVIQIVKKKFEELDFITHTDFQGDLAVFCKDGVWNFINNTGATIVGGFNKINYDSFHNYWAGFDDSKCTILDAAGNIKFAEGGYTNLKFPKTNTSLIAVEKNGMWGAVDALGNVVVPFEYEFTLEPALDCIGVRKNGKWGYLCADGTVKVECKFEDLITLKYMNQDNVWVKSGDGLWYNYDVQTRKLRGNGFVDILLTDKEHALVVPKDFIIEETPINRILAGLPMTEIIPEKKSKKDKKEVTKEVKKFIDCKNQFGNIVNNEGQELFTEPVSLNYFNAVNNIIQKEFNNKPLTQSQMHVILLYLTKNERAYNWGDVINENQWDY